MALCSRVNISAIETYGHEVCEVWSNVWNKWVFMDATRDYYAYCPDTGVPLDLLEMNQRLTEVMPSPATRVSRKGSLLRSAFGPRFSDNLANILRTGGAGAALDWAGGRRDPAVGEDRLPERRPRA